MSPLILISNDFAWVDIASIFDKRSITLNIVAADPRAAANDSKNGGILAILLAAEMTP